MATEDVRRELFLPLYTYSESDFLANVSRGTSSRWLSGYAYRREDGILVKQPPVTPGVDTEAGVSFVDLIEIAAIGKLKKIGWSLPAIRGIVQNCQQLLHVERPFAALKFKIGGREIFVPSNGVLLEVGRKKGMTAWNEVLAPFLEELDYSQELELVRRWWPLGRVHPVVVDPEYGHGLPVILNSGVRTEIVFERFLAGALAKEIANDFNVSEVDVERALQFETLRRAA
jgi:uncharacterized protein (DUF433 family)